MQIVIASHNAGKVREIGELVAPLGLETLSAAALSLPEPEETGETFEANARLKSESAALHARMPALADDSGLAIPALNGAPGIYSARWAGPEKDFQHAMQRVYQELKACGQEPEGAPAYFVCVLAFTVLEEETVFFRGEAHGRLSFPPRGELGFGYDPIFIPEEEESKDQRTFAQMPPDEKHAISHRARAFRQWLDYLSGRQAMATQVI